MTGVVICVISKFVVSGSDDFNIYVWEVPDDWADHDKVLTVGRAFMVLHGHRSIVNQVRFNPETHMLLSAGVEKVIKVGYIIINFESRRQVRNSRRLGFFWTMLCSQITHETGNHKICTNLEANSERGIKSPI